METAGTTQHPKPLHNMFTAVPPRYDLINRIITLGRDKQWRHLAAMTCLEEKPQRVLDLGCGTGDLAINLALRAEESVEITGLDYSLPMLEMARKKAIIAGVGERVQFVHGEATQLPLPDSHFDCVGISFAFRNLTFRNPLCLPHLAEVKRVLIPGGRYVIVESSQPANRIIRKIFHFYLRAFVAPVGTLLSANRGAYHYLAGSASHFYSPDEVRDMLLTVGFRKVIYRPLFLGAAGIHVATS